MLPNVWDAASAQLVSATGFPAIATSSGAIAAALGYPDRDSMPADEAFAAVRRIARAAAESGCPVTADIERGYRLPPTELVDRLLEASAVGCNLEDTDHHSDAELIDIDEQARFLAEVKEAAHARGVQVVLNARVDVFLRRREVTSESFELAVRRATAYLEAGADCIYPIGLRDETAIGEFVQRVDAPVNIMWKPAGPSPARLAELGVARVSLAGGLMRFAYGAAKEKLDELVRVSS